MPKVRTANSSGDTVVDVKVYRVSRPMKSSRRFKHPKSKLTPSVPMPVIKPSAPSMYFFSVKDGSTKTRIVFWMHGKDLHESKNSSEIDAGLVADLASRTVEYPGGTQVYNEIRSDGAVRCFAILPPGWSIKRDKQYIRLYHGDEKIAKSHVGARRVYCELI